MKPEPLESLLDTFLKGGNTEVRERELVTSGGLDPEVLWSRAAKVLARAGHDDVTYDPEYFNMGGHNYRPGIHGEDVTIHMVNGALLRVLREANEMDQAIDLDEWMATQRDSDGWVYCDTKRNA